MGMSRGVYFTLDAMFAAILMVGGFVLISHMVLVQQPTERLEYVSQDIFVAIDNLPVTVIDDPFIVHQIGNGTMNPDNSILEQIAAYWAIGDTVKAQQLSALVMDRVIPQGIGMRLTMGDDVIYEKSQTRHGSIIASRRMVSGVEKGQALSGSTGVGYLKSIHDKHSSAYAYFGGFVGQGNITIGLDPLPGDVNSSRIDDIILEGDFVESFTVFINGMACDNLSPSFGNFSVDRWSLAHCNSSVVSGVNNVSLVFESINDAYIGGGFVRIDYETDTFHTNVSYSVRKKFLPGISGIINLFDSFAVDGTLDALEVFLHYDADHTSSNNTLYFTIGNVTIYYDQNSTTEQSVTLSDSYLSSLLNYTLFSNNTIPFRLGYENLTYHTFYTGNADVVLTTDVSGSMDWNFTDDYSVSVRRNCDNADIYDLSTQRLSVAKCLDKDFLSNILNVSGNRMGLVSYEESTDDTHPLSTDVPSLYAEIGMGVGAPNGYQAGGSTCICCGINSAYDLLSAHLSKTVLVASGSEWLWSNQSIGGNPPLDGNNFSWHDFIYDLESGWESGDAILGHDDGGINVETEMGFDLLGDFDTPDLWEMQSDTASPQVDFTSGLNTTANTYGLAGAVDGWDWSGGVFTFSGSFTTFDVYAGRLRLVTPGNVDSSGAFGISVVITPELYDIISHGGTARLSFKYEWEPDDNNVFENNDQVWLKGRWTSPTSGAHWLGDAKDGGQRGRDNYPEIDTEDDPDNAIYNGFFSQDLSEWVEGPGTYYLELGGKLDRSSFNEWGTFYYDDILLSFSNATDYYYLRHHFTIADLDVAGRAFMNVLSDDGVSVYLNGNMVLEDFQVRNGTYWDRGGIDIPRKFLRTGQNVLAVELRNAKADAAFDLELIGVNDTKKKAMMVMTDGQANERCARQGYTGDLDFDGIENTDSDDAIQAACDAAWDWGILVYAVGFSDKADEPTLQGIARCGTGLYRKSSNVTELNSFYQDVVLNILDISRQSQSIIVASGTPVESVLYGDSYIQMNQSSTVVKPGQNEIELVFQTPSLTACEASFSIPAGLRVSEGYATSYSSDHWTSLLRLDDVTVFNLSRYSANYSHLGDPYIVTIPHYLLTGGLHQISLYTGDDSSNTTGCSANNSVIYRGFVNSSTSRSSVVEFAVGCQWNVEFEDGHFQVFTVPASYTGAKTCSFTNASVVHDPNDAYDSAVFALLSQLDFDHDHRVLVNLGQSDLEIIVSIVSDVPYLWGPAIMEMEVWQ